MVHRKLPEDSGLPLIEREWSVISEAIRAAGAELEDGYIKFGPNLLRLKLDVGLSFDAVQSLHWLSTDPELVVIGFDPIEENIREVRKLITQRGYEGRFIALQLALGSQPGSASFFVTRDDAGSSSLYKPISLPIDREIEVPVVTLASFFEFIDFRVFNRVDFLKTDCQGADLSILIGAGDSISKVALVTCEAEEKGYKGAINAEDKIDAYLLGHGFRRHNPRGRIRKLVGSALYRFKSVHRLYGWVKDFSSKRLPLSPGVEPHVLTEDPTYANIRYLNEIESGQVTAFQKG